MISTIPLITLITPGVRRFEANALPFGLDQLLETPTQKLIAFIHWYYISCEITDNPIDNTYLLFIIPQLLNGLSCLLVFITVLEFICAQAPRTTIPRGYSLVCGVPPLASGTYYM